MVLLRLLILPLAGLSYCSGSVSTDPLHVQGLQQSFPKTGLSPARESSPISADHLEEWISRERSIAFRFLLDNTAPHGSNARDALPGTAIASPSKTDPNYYFQWIRDASITMKDVVDEYKRTRDPKLQSLLSDFANLQSVLQQSVNPSGDFGTGGLGEPKFEINGSPFQGDWGRPQRDGPALRALTLMAYLDAVNQTRPDLFTKEFVTKLYDSKFPTNSTIKADLEYVATYWDDKGFDLWEEVNGTHFFTALVQHKALVKGRDLAILLEDFGAASWYDTQQIALKVFLQKVFWDARKGHLVSTLDNPNREGLDCGLFLGAIHGGQDDLFPQWSDEILVSMRILIDDMTKRHPINSQVPPFETETKLRGVGIGRYPEDVYDGNGNSEGNPWFICTSTVAEILYSTVDRFSSQGVFNITATNAPFYNFLHPEGAAIIKSYNSSDAEFQAYLTAIYKYADSFLNVVRWHITEEGRMSEQFDSKTGFQRGARDLTWSYGSFVSAVEKRKLAGRAFFGMEE